MTTPTPISDVIADAIAAPAAENVDGHAVTERPLAELFEAQRQTVGGQALRKPGRGLIVTKIKRGGALG